MKTTMLMRFVLPGIAVALVLLLVAAEKGPRRQQAEAFMRGKLVCSQLIVEGLVLEQYDVVSKNAVRLRGMTQSNQWFTSRQPDYMRHTTNYQKSVDALFDAALSKDFKRSTEAYLIVTRECIECHQLVRAEQKGSAGFTQAR